MTKNFLPNQHQETSAVVALRMSLASHKFTVGDRWIETALEVTTLLYNASFIHDKLPPLAVGRQLGHREKGGPTRDRHNH